jgi:hypothetical protein
MEACCSGVNGTGAMSGAGPRGDCATDCDPGGCARRGDGTMAMFRACCCAIDDGGRNVGGIGGCLPGVIACIGVCAGAWLPRGVTAPLEGVAWSCGTRTGVCGCRGEGRGLRAIVWLDRGEGAAVMIGTELRGEFGMGTGIGRAP